MTVGTEDEARLEALADDVHRARAAEARRRFQRRRAYVALVLASLAILTVAAIAVVTSGEEAAPASAPPTTTAFRPRAPTSNGDLRPDEAPPVGTIADPASMLVLVDRQRRLPPAWAPPDMVVPQTKWATTDAVERRLLRPEAAAALDDLSRAAARDDVPIIGISAFRSEESQREVYESCVREQGAEAADRFSAAPGHSEHQTGLAVDVAGADGTCPTEPCFALTPQAAWLEEHAPEYGFIVRYPKGKEAITTYVAEPWHLRYAGVGPARAMQRGRLTLDEYLRAA